MMSEEQVHGRKMTLAREVLLFLNERKRYRIAVKEGISKKSLQNSPAITAASTDLATAVAEAEADTDDEGRGTVWSRDVTLKPLSRSGTSLAS